MDDLDKLCKKVDLEEVLPIEISIVKYWLEGTEEYELLDDVGLLDSWYDDDENPTDDKAFDFVICWLWKPEEYELLNDNLFDSVECWLWEPEEYE